MKKLALDGVRIQVAGARASARSRVDMLALRTTLGSCVFALVAIGCSAAPADRAESSTAQALSDRDYREGMRNACAQALGPSLLTADPAMSTDSALDRAKEANGAEIGRIRLSV